MTNVLLLSGFNGTPAEYFFLGVFVMIAVFMAAGFFYNLLKSYNDALDVVRGRICQLEMDFNMAKTAIEDSMAKHAMAGEDIKMIYSLPVIKKGVLDILARKEKESHETI